MSEFRTLPYDELIELLRWREQKLQPEAELERPQQGRIGDAVDMLQMGGYQALAGIADFVGASNTAGWLYDRGDAQMDQLSQRGFDAMNRSFFERDEEGNLQFGEGVTDFDTWMLGIANLAGQFLPTAVPGAGASGLLARGATAMRGGQQLSRGSRLTTDAVAMGATGGAAATGQAMEQARKEFDAIDDDTLAESPFFQDMLSKISNDHGDFTTDEIWEAARDAVREQLASDVRKDPVVLLSNFGISAIGDPILMRALTGRGLSRLGALRGIGATTATGAITEFGQEAGMDYGVQRQVAQVDDRDPGANSILAGLNAAPIGGGFGTVVGTAGAATNRIRGGRRAPLETGSPVVDRAAAELNDTLNEGMDALDGLGARALDRAPAPRDTGAIDTGAMEANRQAVDSLLDGYRLAEPLVLTQGNRYDLPAGIYEFVAPDGTPMNEQAAVRLAQETVDTSVERDRPAMARQEGLDTRDAAETIGVRDEFGRQINEGEAPQVRRTAGRRRIPDGDPDTPALTRRREQNIYDTQDDVDIAAIEQAHDRRTREGEVLPAETENLPDVDNRDPNWSRAERDAVEGEATVVEPEAANQPLAIEDRNIIFAEDDSGISRAGRAAFVETETGRVRIRDNGEVYRTERSLTNSASYREASRVAPVEAVQVDGGWGWRYIQETPEAAPETGLSPANTETLEVGQNIVWQNDNGTLEGAYRGVDSNGNAIVMVDGMQMNAPVNEVFTRLETPEPVVTQEAAPEAPTVTRASDFADTGNYNLSYSGRTLQIYRDPEDGQWYRERLPGEEKHFTELHMGHNRAVAVQNAQEAIDSGALDSAFDRAEDVAETGKLQSRLSKTPDKSGMGVNRLQRFAGSWLGQTGENVGVNVEVFANPEALEASTGESYGFDGQTRAAYDTQTQTVYLFADNIANNREAIETLRHEVLAHHGIRNAMDRAQTLELINRIIATRRSGNQAVQDAWATVERRYPDATDAVKAEEVFALLAEADSSRLGDAWNRVVAAITKFLRSIGLMDSGQVSRAEIRAILADIATNFREGQTNDQVTTQQETPVNERATETGRPPERGIVSGGSSVLASADDAASGTREADGSLRGLPRRIRMSNGRFIEASVFEPAKAAAELYMGRAGIEYVPPNQYVKADPDRGRRIAEAYEAMEHAPQDPEVQAAYQAMIEETLQQYQAIIEETGLVVEFYPYDSEGRIIDPYLGGPREATQDVRDNNHLYVFPTADGYGSAETGGNTGQGFTDAQIADNPMLQDAGILFGDEPATVNDVFRAVRDYFGHVKEGNGFRADGEENAWQSHAAMYSPLARRAMTSETRGQNSWLNFGPYGETNRTAGIEDTVFAEQKVGLLPEWVSDEGRLGGADLDGSAMLQSRMDRARDLTRHGYRKERAEGQLTQSELDSIRETDKMGWGRLKKLFARLFKPGGLLPNQAYEAALQRDNDVKVHAFDMKGRINAFNEAVNKSFGRQYDRLTPTERRTMNDYLLAPRENKEGIARQHDFSPELVTALDAMRGHVDALSTEYMARLEAKISAQEAVVMDRMREEGVPLTEESMAEAFAADTVIQNTKRLIEVFDSNMGTYLHRSYRAFDDTNWHRKVPQAVVDNALTYLMEQAMEANPEMSQNEARQEALMAVQDILKGSTAYDSLQTFISEGRFGSRDTRHLWKRSARLAASPEIRALLGEYTDPTTNYAKTVAKSSTLIANEIFLTTMLTEGLGTFLFTKEGRDPLGNAVTEIAGTKNDAYAPLNGLYATKEMNTALKDLLGDPKQEGWANILVQANAYIKYGKTVLSPTTAMRNVMSSTFSIMNAGHMFGPKGRWRKAAAAFKEQVLGKSDAETDAYFRELISQGVLNDSVSLGEMKVWVRDGGIDAFLESNPDNRALSMLSGLNKKAQGFYRFGDDFWKIAGWESEKQMLMEAGFSEAEASKQAATTIKNLYPTYSRVGLAGRWLSRFPLVGTFVSFPAEIIRTTYNTIEQLSREVQSDNPKIRQMGYRRIAGMAMAHSATFALAALTKAALGVTDEEEQAIRDMAPSWSENSTFLWAGRDSEGNIRYFDMTFIDLYGQWKRPIEAIMRGKPWQETFSMAARDMLLPFLGTDITAGTIFETVSNRKDSGAQVYKPNDSTLRQTVDITKHLVTNLQPGFLGNAMRLSFAATERKRGLGQPYDMGDELLALLGFRSTTFDPAVSLYYRTFQFNQDLAEARVTLSEVVRNPNRVSDRELAAAKARAQKKQDRAFEDMANLVRLAQGAGLSRSEINQLLRLQNVSEQNVRALFAGRTPPIDMSPQSIRRAMRQASIVEGEEGFRRVRERALKSRGLAE